jgi:hypothetical protein
VVDKPEPRRLERKADMSLAEMLSDLPTRCAVGTKRNARPIRQAGSATRSSRVADGDSPISAVLTSASLNDGDCAAIPLATMTACGV